MTFLKSFFCRSPCSPCSRNFPPHSLIKHVFFPSDLHGLSMHGVRNTPASHIPFSDVASQSGSRSRGCKMSLGHLPAIILVAAAAHTCAALKCFSENQQQQTSPPTTTAPSSSLLASLLSPSASSDSTKESSFRLETCSQFPSYSDPLVCFSRTRFRAYQLLDDVDGDEGSHRQRGCARLSSLRVPG